MNKMVHEVYKMMKGKEPMELPIQHMALDISAFTGFSGKAPCKHYTWNVDSGASSHMCYL